MLCLQTAARDSFVAIATAATVAAEMLRKLSLALVLDVNEEDNVGS